MAGIAVAGIVLFALVWYIIRRRRSTNRSAPKDPVGLTPYIDTDDKDLDPGVSTGTTTSRGAAYLPSLDDGVPRPMQRHHSAPQNQTPTRPGLIHSRKTGLCAMDHRPLDGVNQGPTPPSDATVPREAAKTE